MWLIDTPQHIVTAAQPHLLNKMETWINEWIRSTRPGTPPEGGVQGVSNPDVEEQRLDSELPLCDPAPHPVSKGNGAILQLQYY